MHSKKNNTNIMPSVTALMIGKLRGLLVIIDVIALSDTTPDEVIIAIYNDSVQ